MRRAAPASPARGHAGVRAHAEPDDRHLRDLVLVAHAHRADLGRHHPAQLERAAQIVAADRERDVGAAVSAGVLDDHIDHDAGLGDGAENACRQSGPVGHSGERDLALILVERDARHHHFFHLLVLLADPGALGLAEAGAHHQRHAVAPREFDRAQLEHLRPQPRHLHHLVVRDAREFARARTNVGVGGEYALDVGVDFAGVRLERGRKRDRRQVRSPAPERGDVAHGIDALVAGHDRDISAAQRLGQPLGVDRTDLRVAMVGVGRELELMRQEGDGRIAERLQANCQQGR